MTEARPERVEAVVDRGDTIRCSVIESGPQSHAASCIEQPPIALGSGADHRAPVLRGQYPADTEVVGALTVVSVRSARPSLKYCFTLECS